MRAGGGSWHIVRMVGAFVLAILVVSTLLWLDRESLERGNRLYRRGDVGAAVQVYQAHAEGQNRTAKASYNLGTALLALDEEGAELHLGLAVQGVDSVAQQRAFYNLGYLRLYDVAAQVEADSIVALLGAAVELNRAALRLDPSDDSARWNLAYAQRQLDALVEPVADPIAEPPQARGGAQEESMEMLPVEPPLSDEALARLAALVGAREARVGQGDPGPLTEEDARLLLQGTEDDPERLLRGMFWTQRPVRTGWYSKPLPGGRW